MWDTARRPRTAAGEDVAVFAGPRPAWARTRRMVKDLALCIVTSIDVIGIEVDFFCSGPRVYEGLLGRECRCNFAIQDPTLTEVGAGGRPESEPHIEFVAGPSRSSLALFTIPDFP